MSEGTTRLHEKFLLHTDGTQQFGGYSGGPTFLAGVYLYIDSDLVPTYLNTTENSALKPRGSKIPIPCM